MPKNARCTGLESLKLQPLPQCKVAHRRRFTDGKSTGVGCPIHTRGWRLETVSGRQPASASYKTPVSLSLGGTGHSISVNTIKYNIKLHIKYELHFHLLRVFLLSCSLRLTLHIVKWLVASVIPVEVDGEIGEVLLLCGDDHCLCCCCAF